MGHQPMFGPDPGPYGHGGSRQDILYLKGCPAQRPVSSHGHGQALAAPQACGMGAYCPGLGGGRKDKDNKGGSRH